VGDSREPVVALEFAVYKIWDNRVKPVAWIDDSLERLREFPPDARNDAGYQLDQVARRRQA